MHGLGAGPATTALLDVDGTIIDSNDAHAWSWIDAFAELGHRVDFRIVRPLIGMGGDKLIAGVTIVALRGGGWRAEERGGAAAIYADPTELLREYDRSAFARSGRPVAGSSR